MTAFSATVAGLLLARDMIRKIKGKYVVLSEKTGRRFGSYDTLEEAKRRLRQVEFFKHRDKKKR